MTSIVTSLTWANSSILRGIHATDPPPRLCQQSKWIIRHILSNQTFYWNITMWDDRILIIHFINVSKIKTIIAGLVGRILWLDRFFFKSIILKVWTVNSSSVSFSWDFSVYRFVISWHGLSETSDSKYSFLWKREKYLQTLTIVRNEHMTSSVNIRYSQYPFSRLWVELLVGSAHGRHSGPTRWFKYH